MMPSRSSCTRYFTHFGFGERVGGDDLLEGPLAQAADRQQQQLAVGHDRASCSSGELAAQRLGVGHLARQLGEIHLQHAQHLVDARQRHVALGEHALDARLGQAELARQVGIGDARGAQLGLQRRDEGGGSAHRDSPLKIARYHVYGTHHLSVYALPSQHWCFSSVAKTLRPFSAPGYYPISLRFLTCIALALALLALATRPSPGRRSDAARAVGLEAAARTRRSVPASSASRISRIRFR